jgi:serine/threonine-protein kinase
MIGKTISHYKIIEKLGQGGMGVVYLADDTKLKRQVAIKFLPEHLTKDKENVERFEREAEAAAALNHPNIVTIYDVLEEDDPTTAGKQLCIVMEYVDGISLREYVGATGSVAHTIENTITIITQIAEGLSKAHQAGIVHRDIKPENIIIDKDDRVKILDFGLAKLKGVSKLTKETSTLGTIHYMSPEQIQGKDVDERSDIWSLSVVMYELLTGKPPFTGDYEQAVSYAILNENIKQVIDKDLPEDLVKIIEKCLTKNPDDRYQNVDEIKGDLSFLKEESSVKPTR